MNRLSGDRLEKVLDGKEMTGREAALWLVLTAVFGIIVFVAVFVL